MIYNPKVVCLCPTFNRPKLLKESIKCFIDQDYNNKELIILNDQEKVTLKVNNLDNISIYNINKRFESLGEKRNYLKSLKEADYYCIWDDDDLYVPYRIKESVNLMLENPKYDIIKPKDSFISIDNVKYKVATNRFHPQAIVTKKYMQSHNYPHKSIGEDAAFERDANIGYMDIFPSIWSVFRYGMDTYHISSVPNHLEQKSWKFAGEIADSYGEIIIEPEFEKDYWKEVSDALDEINGFWGKEFLKKIG